jgi:probable phosphoglycerate mutase
MPVVVVRHGQTEWSAAGRHTGRTDIALDATGREQALALGEALHRMRPDRVITSPRSRALETCRLAGFGAEVEIDDRLVEWDYGTAEGRTTLDMQQDQPGWTVWTHAIVGGESLDDVRRRADLVIADLVRTEGTTLVFSHAHFSRILAARWCRLPARTGRNLILDTARIGVLGDEHGTPAISRWNEAPCGQG